MPPDSRALFHIFTFSYLNSFCSYFYLLDTLNVFIIFSLLLRLFLFFFLNSLGEIASAAIIQNLIPNGKPILTAPKIILSFIDGYVYVSVYLYVHIHVGTCSEQKRRPHGPQVTGCEPAKVGVGNQIPVFE